MSLSPLRVTGDDDAGRDSYYHFPTAASVESEESDSSSGAMAMGGDATFHSSNNCNEIDASAPFGGDFSFDVIASLAGAADEYLAQNHCFESDADEMDNDVNEEDDGEDEDTFERVKQEEQQEDDDAQYEYRSTSPQPVSSLPVRRAPRPSARLLDNTDRTETAQPPRQPPRRLSAPVRAPLPVPAPARVPLPVPSATAFVSTGPAEMPAGGNPRHVLIGGAYCAYMARLPALNLPSRTLAEALRAMPASVRLPADAAARVQEATAAAAAAASSAGRRASSAAAVSDPAAAALGM
jgi:hypothetical protein